MRVRRQAELLPDSGVKLPCLSARNQSFIDIAFGQIEPLRECHRFGVGRPPKIVEKLSHNFATTLEFLLVGSIFGFSARLVSGPDHDTFGAGCQAFEFLLVGTIFSLSARLIPGPDHDTFGAGCQAFEFLLVGTIFSLNARLALGPDIGAGCQASPCRTIVSSRTRPAFARTR